jgi:hypothetical protein
MRVAVGAGVEDVAVEVVAAVAVVEAFRVPPVAVVVRHDRPEVHVHRAGRAPPVVVTFPDHQAEGVFHDPREVAIVPPSAAAAARRNGHPVAIDRTLAVVDVFLLDLRSARPVEIVHRSGAATLPNFPPGIDPAPVAEIVRRNSLRAQVVRIVREASIAPVGLIGPAASTVRVAALRAGPRSFRTNPAEALPIVRVA